MKVGIYIDGLGQSVAEENAISYATRLTNELKNHTEGIQFDIKIEKVKYLKELESNVISIIQRQERKQTVIYKLYEYQYGEQLTKDYNEKNILYKNYLLFSIVFKKLPLLIKRIFVPTKGYNFTFQTFYIFSLFFFVALSILFMIPSTLAVISSFEPPKEFITYIKEHQWLYESAKWIKDHLIVKPETFVSIIAFILLIVPKANVVIPNLASEFVSAHLYLQFGQKKQDILGNIDELFDYICENETDAEIHFHTYSFGTLIALDYVFPYGNEISGNTLNRTKGIITIGCPYDFINSYYPSYYIDRCSKIESKKIKWINVYSIFDALGSNFRNNPDKGEAEYGVGTNGLYPVNINYEVANLNQTSFFNFLLLNNLKIHGMYWSNSTEGRSCLNPIFNKMLDLHLIEIATYEA